MSKRNRLFIHLILRFNNRREPVRLLVTSTLHITRSLCLWRLGGCLRILRVLHPCVVPDNLNELAL